MASKANSIIAIDLGGTHMRGAFLQEEGRLCGREQQPSQGNGDAAAILDDILRLITTLEAHMEGKAAAVGIGLPGILEYEAGVLYESPHFPQVQQFPFREQFQQRVPIPLYLDNDANCAVMGEARYGAGQDVTDLIMLTLGTGIGGGIIRSGEVMRGEYGYAGELGHIVLESKGPPCHCGSRGCFEMYASATGLVEATGRAPDVLYAAALTGDEKAQQAFETMGYYLGVGIASLVNVLGIHTVLIGGGLSGAWEFFSGKMFEEFARRSYRETARLTQIKQGALGDDAGLLGAAYGAARLLRSVS